VAETPYDSFEQEIFIREIKDPFCVYKDPDGDYCFVRQVMTRSEFNHKFPKYAKEEGFEDDISGMGEDLSLWYKDDRIFVADYYYKKYRDVTIAEVVHPLTQDRWIVELNKDVTIDILVEAGFQVMRTKKGKTHDVKMAKLTAKEVIAETDWPGKEIPVIEVQGDHVNVAGKVYKRSLVRDAKDPQRMYNYSLTHNTEIVAMQPKAPYLVTQKQVEGHERLWNQVNKKNLSYVLFNGKAGDKPRREPPPQISPGASALMGFAAGDIQDTIGLFEASFGEKSNERTGIAIDKRANRSDFSTFHFSDNYKRAIMETTRQLIDVIPKIYDSERVQRIIGEDGTEIPLVINQTLIDPLNPGNAIIVNDLNYGKYDVVEGVKLWSTRRQEQEEAMIAFASGAPNIAPLLLPEIAEAQDWPGASELAAKMEKWLPALMGIKQPSEDGTPPTGGGNQMPG